MTEAPQDNSSDTGGNRSASDQTGWASAPSPSAPPRAPLAGRHSAGPVDRRVVPTSPPQSFRPVRSVQPARSPMASGGNGLLPPTLPPGVGAASDVLIEPEAKRSGNTRWGWRALVAFVAGGLIAASGFAVSEFSADPEVAQTEVVDAGVTRSETPAAPPIIVEAPDLDTTEPAAFVAQILGPSVVQIEVPNVGLGSGVVFADGLILTNNHVVDGATTVDVRTSSGRVIKGEVLGSDARTDVAVISVGEGSGLPIAQLASSSELEVGQLSIAIGSPFELQQTVTSGIISALNRPLFNGVGLNAMIQTDAAINPGNSGGPLSDRNGRVIGINTAIQTDGIGNSNIGVGYAVPIDTALNIANRILDGEPLVAGFLGVAGGQADSGASGVEVTEVTPGSAAEDAGVRNGDRIVKMDGAPITSLEALAGLVQTRFPGDDVDLEIVRNGETVTLTATLGER